jgi:hypothetical protein
MAENKTPEQIEKEKAMVLRNEVFSAVDSIVHNDGYMLNNEGEEVQVSLQDMVTKEDLLPLIPQALTHIMLDEIEPMSVIYDAFFTELKMTDVQKSLIVHNIGPLTVQPLGEYGEYPETNLAIDQDGQEINLRVQRYGIELRLHEDVVKQNLLPLVSMWMTRARNAFVRNREKLAIQELKKTGIVTFDNNSPGSYVHEVKSYTGRDITGAYNGTMSLNDLMEMYVKALLDGFTLDTIAMHPFAWQTFMTDPDFKEIIVNNNTVVSFRPPNGTGAVNRFKAMEFGGLGLPWSKGAGNGTMDPTLAKLGQNPYSLNQSLLGAEYNIAPKYFPTPLKIVVSPYVPLSKIGNTTVTDIIFAEGGESGVVLREGDPIVKQFSVEEKEAVVTRMREGLAFGTMNLGKAVRVAKNVVIDRNYVFNNVNSVTLGYGGASTQMDAQQLSRGPY